MANGQNPIVIDNVTLVPIRTVSLIPNLKVHWDNKSKTVMVTDSDTKNKLKLTVGSNSAYVNDKKISVGVNPTVKEGAVYVPFRFIGEELNAKVCGILNLQVLRDSAIFPFHFDVKANRLFFQRN
ncbi:copper amine oxidase N-terminal domain-containing protein [Paenibacillus polymyxa]|uniref:copper amine oxidase N-terminal domain-containing protein n=1 Tax=Paenibacillus polymyxa TaxID=1406 RepID=UPI00287FB407|nr:copper amine oxidase N-terminal domain-containing protein [Paenibacillus polymyxa]